MSPVKKAVAFIIEKAKEETPADRAALYRIAAELTPDESLAEQLNEAAKAIDAAIEAQLKLNLTAKQALN